MERRKLFSTIPAQRRKLFSIGQSEVEQHAESALNSCHRPTEIVCMDCGYRAWTKSECLDKMIEVCPKCGGSRFELVSQLVLPVHGGKVNQRALEESADPSEERDFSRLSLFGGDDEEMQKEFSTPGNEFEERLKQFSGKEITKKEYEKYFSAHISADEFMSNGYGEESGEKIKIFSNAYLQSKLFSCIRMSITKTLELDPAVMSCAGTECGKFDIIKKLESEDRLCPKAIMLIKKAHNYPMQAENEEWMKDSGICDDVKLEFGGSSKDLSDFKKTIEERYPDAPEDILDLLKEKGIIKSEGNHIEVIK